MKRPAASIAFVLLGAISFSCSQEHGLEERARQSTERWKARGLTEDYKGIHTRDGLIAGLYPIRNTGVSTEAVRNAANSFLDSLDAERRLRTMFAVDDEEWRVWMNRHLFFREGG